MRKIILAALLCSVSASGVMAADAVIYSEPSVPAADPVTSFSWSGAYAGVQLGHGWGKSRYVDSIGGHANIDPTGFLGGVYVGYNHQLDNNLVIGVDADIAYADMSGSAYLYEEGVNEDLIGEGRVRWTAAARARLGYAMDRFMPYIAGGIAFARYDASMSFTFDPAIGSFGSHTRTGWTIGAGAEYALNDRLVLRGEYRYSDFGKKSLTPAIEWPAADVSLKIHDVRLGLAVKF